MISKTKILAALLTIQRGLTKMGALKSVIAIRHAVGRATGSEGNFPRFFTFLLSYPGISESIARVGARAAL